MGWNEHFHECRRHILSKWSGQQVSFLIHNKENFCINLPWWSQKILQQLYAMGSRLISHEVNSAVGKSKTDEGHCPCQKIVFLKHNVWNFLVFIYDLLWSNKSVWIETWISERGGENMQLGQILTNDENQFSKSFGAQPFVRLGTHLLAMIKWETQLQLQIYWEASYISAWHARKSFASLQCFHLFRCIKARISFCAAFLWSSLLT